MNTPDALSTLPARIRRPIQLIVLHCSATPSGQWIGGPAPRKAPTLVIDQWHFDRGFKRRDLDRARFNSHLTSIGYHYVIDLDGEIYTGRHVEEVGAHVVGHNANSLGICLVGGAEREARYTSEQWMSLGELVLELRQRPDVAGAGLLGHRDLSPDTDGDGRVEPHEWLKTCPGFDVSTWRAAHMEPAPEHLCPSVIPSTPSAT